MTEVPGLNTHRVDSGSSGQRIGEWLTRRYQPALSVASALVLLVTWVGFWLVMTPYAGLTHNAQAYAMQALARLDPQVLGQDVFLRYASQDRFTIFPAIYGFLVERFGLEPTAAVLTLAFHALWYTAAFLIARHLFGTTLAMLCVGLLVAIPGPYGGQKIFHIAEPFLTARLPAEAICLLAVWTYLTGRKWSTAALLALAGLIHPLMTFPAALLVAFLHLESSRPRGWTLVRGGLALGLAAIVGSAVLGGATRIMDEAWVQTVYSRSGFLFLGQWRTYDWNHTLLTLATLTMAATALPFGTSRNLARTALALGVTGLMLTWFSGEILQLKVLMQGQPWRWLWIGRFLAILLLPAIMLSTWQAGAKGRTASALLAAAWLWTVPISAQSQALLLMGSLLAGFAVLVWISRERLTARAELLASRGAWAALALVLASAAITTSLSAMVVSIDADTSTVTPRFISMLKPITPVIVATVIAWAGVVLFRRSWATALVLAGSLALIVAFTPSSAERWFHQKYGGDNRESFSDWRKMIPPESEVFWWDSLQEVWFLLDRRSYLTLSQGGGVVFSSDVSAELRRRAENVREFVDSGYWFNEAGTAIAEPQLSTSVLASICKDPALGFVVSKTDLGLGAPSKAWPTANTRVYLYDCRPWRRESP